MEMIRPSDRQLIVKTPGNLRKVIRQFLAIAPFWMVVTLIFVSTSRIAFPVYPDLITTILIALFPYVGCGCIAIATTRDHTAVFDLDLQAVRIECYWVLFKKRQYQHYNLFDINNIVVTEDNEVDWFYIRLRLFNGEDVYISHAGERAIVEAKAQEIRYFLDLRLKP
jgi:hypothetical protein